MQKDSRVTMEVDLELQRTYGYNAVCGYIRSPILSNNRISGLCILDYQPCTRDLPMSESSCKRCKKYFLKYQGVKL